MIKAKLSAYNCAGVRAIDGDSFICRGDVSPIAPDCRAFEPRVRLIGVDTPERGEDGWSEARDFLNAWIMDGPFNLLCFGRDKYGRMLADAERGDGLLSEKVWESGHGARMTLEEVRVRLMDPEMADVA